MKSEIERILCHFTSCVWFFLVSVIPTNSAISVNFVVVDIGIGRPIDTASTIASDKWTIRFVCVGMPQHRTHCDRPNAKNQNKQNDSSYAHFMFGNVLMTIAFNWRCTQHKFSSLRIFMIFIFYFSWFSFLLNKNCYFFFLWSKIDRRVRITIVIEAREK